MEPEAAAKRAGLSYVHALPPGILRRKAGRGWSYLRPNGAKVTRSSELRRIRQLVIPPMWQRVWIAPSPTAHLQAIGYDARGRRQYLYHPTFLAIRNESKFSRLSAFASALPQLRRRARAGLQGRQLTRERVLAALIILLDGTSLRVGNLEYLRANGSFGLTTLTRRHVSLHGAAVTFCFKGKSGILQEVEMRDGRVAEIIRQCLELPGRQLFQYVDDSGRRRSIRAADVNEYIHAATGGQFTAKDFRTWKGTCTAYGALCSLPRPGTKAEAKRAVVAAVKQVAGELGNRPATSRQFYIHPAIAEIYLNSVTAGPGAPRFPPERTHSLRRAGLTPDEQRVLQILTSWQGTSALSPAKRPAAGQEREKTAQLENVSGNSHKRRTRF